MMIFSSGCTIDKIRKIFGDFIYSMAGVCIFNAVLQFFLYPELYRHFGSDGYGKILFYISLMTVFSNSFGVAVDNVRLTMRSRIQFANGDFNLTLVIFSGITLIFLLPFVIGKFKIWQSVMFAILAIATLLRYYGTVVYRLNIDYKSYFIYFLCLSSGYVAGVFLLRFTADWITVFLLGEIAAIIFAVFQGKLFEKPLFDRSRFKIFFQNSIFLALAEFLHNLIMNLDRILLILIISPLANTQFYVASLIAKVPIFLVQPINNLILSYLTRKKKQINLKYFIFLLLSLSVLSFLMFGGCRLLSPYFIKWFYPGEFDGVSELLTLVCLGQTLLFAGNILLVLLLTFSGSRNQFFIQLFYFITFVSFGVLLTVRYGISGFAWAFLIANCIRCMVAVAAGIYLLRAAKKEYVLE